MSYTTTLTVSPHGAGDALRTAAEADWAAAVDHRFIRELFAGTVDEAVLRTYVEQDYTFFTDFVALLGGCVATAPKPESKIRYAAQLGMLAADEDTYFTRALEAVGGENLQRRQNAWKQPTRDFNRLMHDAAQSQNYAQMLTVLLVAEWLYLDWGERTDLGEPDSWLHLDWIELHRGDDFRSWSQFLLDELEEVWPADKPEQGRLTNLFCECVAVERAFFDAAY